MWVLYCLWVQLKLAQEERKRFEEKLALAELRRAVESMQGLDAKLRSKEQEVSRVVWLGGCAVVCRLRQSQPVVYCWDQMLSFVEGMNRVAL